MEIKQIKVNYNKLISLTQTVNIVTNKQRKME